MSNETVEALKAARALIDTPEKWTRNTSARDAAGSTVLPVSPDAVCFCIYGALSRVLSDSSDEGIDILHKALSIPNNVWFAEFNDAPSTTHADVMALFDRAIARAEREA